MNPRDRLIAAVDRVLAVLEGEVKSVRTMADDFEVRLSEAVADFFNGKQTAAQVSRVMRNLIKGYARDEYLEGMKDGGIDEPEADITDEEEAQVDAWITEQLGFVAGFIEALQATRSAEDVSAAQNAINERVTLWRGSLENLGSLGKASALQNMMVTWRLGPTEEHCETGDGKTGCANLDGKRRRLKWFTQNGYIPQENASATLACGGWRCQCRLVDDKGKQVLP